MRLTMLCCKHLSDTHAVGGEQHVEFPCVGSLHESCCGSESAEAWCETNLLANNLAAKVSAAIPNLLMPAHAVQAMHTAVIS